VNEPPIFVAVKASETRFLTALKIIAVNSDYAAIEDRACGEADSRLAPKERAPILGRPARKVTWMTVSAIL